MGGAIEQLLKGNDTLFFIKDKVCMGQPQWNSRWDWLMPVVEKIESLSNLPKVIHYSRQSKTIFDFKLTEAKLEKTYQAIIEFIKWCNEQKQ